MVKIKEMGFIVLISISIFANISFLFEQRLFTMGYAVQIITPLFIFVSFRKYAIKNVARVISYCYVLFIIYSFLVTVFSENADVALIRAGKVYYRLFVFFILLIVLNPKNFSNKVIKFPMFIGLLLAIQTILLSLLFYLGHGPECHWVRHERFSIPVLDCGVWGYATHVLGRSTAFETYRAQSFFGEPSKLSAFLQYGIFIAFGFYKIRKKIRYLMIFVICLVSFILTFSHAGYVAVMSTVLIYLLHSHTKSSLYKPICLFLGAALVVISMVIFMNFAVQLYSKASLSRAYLAFGKTPKSIEGRFTIARNDLRLFAKYPFGIGLVGYMESDIVAREHVDISGIAPVIWLIRTGFVGFGLLVFILYYTYRRIISYTIVKPKDISCYLGLVFISQTLHHFSFGNWMDMMYLYILALLINTHRYGFQDSKDGKYDRK